MINATLQWVSNSGGNVNDNCQQLMLLILWVKDSSIPIVLLLVLVVIGTNGVNNHVVDVLFISKKKKKSRYWWGQLGCDNCDEGSNIIYHFCCNTTPMIVKGVVINNAVITIIVKQAISWSSIPFLLISSFFLL